MCILQIYTCFFSSNGPETEVSTSTTINAKPVELPVFFKMKVKTAAQVFCGTVSAALEIHSMLIGAGTSETAEFLMTFNNVFDAMNSSKLNDPNKRQCAITNKCDQLEFYKYSSEWI